jgi:AraC-like DNA-binding protein
MIALDRLLDGLHVDVEPIARRDPGSATVRCARSGSGVVGLACGTTLRFAADSMTIVPPRRLRAVPDGGGTPMTSGHRDAPAVITAYMRIRATYQGAVNLFDDLSEPLVQTLVANDPIRSCLDELVDEISATRPGRYAMTEVLLRRALVLFLRRCVPASRAGLSWAAAIEDTRLGRAVGAMREHPEHAFTLPELAEVAGMSRTVFAARFVDAVGQPPIEFLKRLRLSRAAELLTRTDLPIKTIASRIGYSSRSSFTRAFVASRGAAPKTFRSAASEPAPARVNGKPRLQARRSR